MVLTAGDFWTIFTDVFSYISYRIPEISDEIYKIIKAGLVELNYF